VGIVKQFRKVSNLELLPGRGIQYARSSGSWGRVVGKDEVSCAAVVYLPSGVRKVVSLFSLVAPGRAAALDKRDVSNTRSGY
jgi:ribosomal protein L2